MKKETFDFNHLSDQMVLDLINLYPTIAAFQKDYPSIYNRIKKKKLKQKYFKHIKEKAILNKELRIKEIQNIVSKFSNMSELKKTYPTICNYLYKNKLTSKFCTHMIPKKNQPIKYTLEALIKIGLKYKSIYNFQKYNFNAYAACSKKGWLEIVCKHMSRKIKKNLSDRDLFDIAKKYQSRGEFQKNDQSIYMICRKRQLLEQACSHMRPSSSKRIDDENLRLRALKYKHRSDLERYDKKAYECIRDRGKLDEFCSHMEHPKRSIPEKEIEMFIRILFPNAHKKMFRNIAIKRRPYIKSFELDIYIPEINKAIELDGVYWHSSKLMVKNRGKWTINARKNYHQIKDKYFKDFHNIDILHITDIEWKKFNEKSKQKILKFIKS